MKANRALVKISDKKEQTKEWQRNYKELCVATRLLNSELAKIGTTSEFVNLEITKPLDGEVWPWPDGEPGKDYITNPEACPLFRTLVFLRHGVTFRELVGELERNPDAHKKWMQIHDEYHRVRWGDASALDGAKMKFKLTHFQIIVQGLAFGLRELNQEELAECLDEICPCSQRHSSEYLKKLRSEMIKACRSLKTRNAQSTGTAS